MKMVFEDLVKATKAEKSPLIVFMLGILYGTIGIIFDLWFFNGRIENLYIFITVFAAIPLMHGIISFEESKDKYIKKERSLLMEHKKALVAFMVLFVGVLVAFTFWFTVLPEESVGSLFSSQIKEIPLVHQSIISGSAVNPGYFSTIFGHNMKVLVFSFVFSFFFGAGAIFILTWNAALIATALGTFFRQSLGEVSGSGAGLMLTYVGTMSYGFFGYMTHGFFEIASYFLAGLAGGIISVAVIRHELFSKHFNRIVVDSLWLLGLAILVLLVSGVLETSLSPLIFS
jgi:uncharacterized membrane protein SpoIIM required for sporulation